MKSFGFGLKEGNVLENVGGIILKYMLEWVDTCNFTACRNTVS